ncbi:MAG: DUF3142 domain-containing protein [Verrucomicrobia bacterium]|nr:DUF3142 domain-containing protein [Verrucomicrobiota bacterium]
MKHRLLSCVAIAAALSAVLLWPRDSGRASGPMPHDVYIWQRAWTESLDDAISEHAGDFAELVALKAEVSWQDNQPRVVRVALDYPSLRNAGRPISLALRIGAYSGPFNPDSERTHWLTELAASILSEAQTNELDVAELQIDFDCAESKLEGYRVWVEAIRRRVAPVPVTITALPSWLKRPAFKRLVAAADGYVLQVHSLARPRNPGAPFSLCDPAEARRAVEKAGRLGKPFRVALPTYGYIFAFDGRGQFAGISAEGPAKLWPDGTQLREVRANPETMAQLVADWKNDRPQGLTGVIWYRLPVASDSLNWSWPTLAAVMNGQVPRSDVRVETHRPQPQLVEIDLVNAGPADHAGSVHVGLSWHAARLVAADGLHGFELNESGPNSVRFTVQRALARLEAGQRRTIGWLRFDQDADVTVALEQRSD